ncbi:AAA family ATPase [Kitasatospora sp. NPDC101176]|uniref:AAA family ATPase n=1 Tax=Kitasatospora sp. NPDC101176 TaxID=3364099 RepID=UPI00382A1747
MTAIPRGERFRDLRLSTDEPFTVLYGPGVDDVFVDPDYGVRALEETLWGLLRSEGYRRIVFSSLSRPLYFRDPESRRLSRPGWERAEPDGRGGAAENGPATGKGGSTAGGTGAAPATGRMRRLRGPLGTVRLPTEPGTGPGSADAATAAPARPSSAVADPFAVMTHLGLLRRPEPRTAVVYTQAEEILLHNQASRQLAAALADRAQDRLGHNRWIFVFRASTLEGVERTVADRRVYPALAAFLRAELDHPGRGGAFRIGYPDEAELGRLVQHLRLRDRLRIGDWRELAPLLRSFADRPRRASAWREDLRRLAADGTPLERRAALDRGLVTAVTTDGESPWTRLDAMPGLAPVKRHLRLLANRIEAERALPARRDAATQHLVFSGNPGTGKTTVARLVGEIYRDLGLLRRGHLVEADASALVAGFVGQTAERTNALVDRALDGVLFLDEAYALHDQREGFGREAVTALLARMENDRGRLVVVLAGYPERMREFIASDPGLDRRIRAWIDFPDYDPATLHTILLGMLADRRIHPAPETGELLSQVVTGLRRVAGEGFGNAGTMRLLADDLFDTWAGRVQRQVHLPLLPADLPERYRAHLPRPVPTTGELLAELDHLVGLRDVREFLTGLTERLAMRQARGLPDTTAPHLLFLGPPGTGKTTVARLVGRICHTLGLLHTDEVVEVTRADLVGRYQGHTAVRTREVVRSALDKVLFIDEAYSLASGTDQDDFGQEAVDTLLREMMENPGRLVVIAAGYPLEMRRFLDANSGLRSRFGQTLHFDHYPTADLVEILRRQAATERYLLSDGAAQRAAAWFDARRAASPRDFGNARAVAGLLREMETRLARRLGPDGWDGAVGEPITFLGEDVPPAR